MLTQSPCSHTEFYPVLYFIFFPILDIITLNQQCLFRFTYMFTNFFAYQFFLYLRLLLSPLIYLLNQVQIFQLIKFTLILPHPANFCHIVSALITSCMDIIKSSRLITQVLLSPLYNLLSNLPKDLVIVQLHLKGFCGGKKTKASVVSMSILQNRMRCSTTYLNLSFLATSFMYSKSLPN